MTLPEQTALILYAGRKGFIQPPDARRWALSVIETMHEPPNWLIELATTPFRFMDDVFATLQSQAAKLGQRQKLQIIIIAFESGALSFAESLRQLFQAAFLDHDESSLPLEEDDLIAALADWNFLDDLNAIPPALESRFRSVFARYLAEAECVASVIRLPRSHSRP